MSSVYQSFKVKIEAFGMDEMLDATFNSLWWEQTSGNGISHAVWRFNVKALMGEYIADVLPKAVAQATDRAFAFQIFDLEDTPLTLKQQHLVVSDKAEYKSVGETHVLEIKTAEKLKTLLSQRNRSAAWEGESLDKIVKQVVGTDTEIEMEKCKEIEEFRILRQPYISDYDFIVKEINPRAVSEKGESAYRFFTSDGVTAYWGPVGFNLRGTLKVTDVMIEESVPMINWGHLVEQGAVKHSSESFDTSIKEIIRAEDPGLPTPKYGDIWVPDDIKKEAEDFSLFPMNTPEALDGMNRHVRWREAYSAYPYIVKCRGGDRLWDHVPYNMLVENIHDQGGGEITAYANYITHRIERGEYSIWVGSLRDRHSSI